jgi:hypothetical protein
MQCNERCPRSTSSLPVARRLFFFVERWLFTDGRCGKRRKGSGLIDECAEMSRCARRRMSRVSRVNLLLRVARIPPLEGEKKTLLCHFPSKTA